MSSTEQHRGTYNVAGSDISVDFIAAPSATAPRNGAGFHPCQGLFFYPSDRPVHTAFIAAHTSTLANTIWRR